ncbi:MAG: hypothetical protein IJ725_04995 [Ruminococcus sp.]|nr:hypothetical protein [Ruminococcus sp.]
MRIKDYLLGVIGFLAGVFGVYWSLEGDSLIKDNARQFISILSTGEKDNSGYIKLYFGLALLVAGIVLMLVNFGIYWNANIATEQNKIEE